RAASPRDRHSGADASYRYRRSECRTTSPARLGFDSSRLQRLQQLEDPGERDAHPVGPVIQLVAQFVKCLFEQVYVQKNVQLIAISREKVAGLHMLEVRVQEGRTNPDVPYSRP